MSPITSSVVPAASVQDVAGPISISPARRRGWYKIADDTPPEVIVEMRKFPGVVDAPTDPEVWLPWNLVSAFPGKFVGCDPKIPLSSELSPSNLRGYQEECVRFGLTRGGRGLYLGLDLGLGKTRTACAIAVTEKHKRVLVLGPLVSRAAWCGEKSDPFQVFGLDVQPLFGVKDVGERARELFKDPNGWWFCHYDILQAWAPWILTQLRPQCVIMDEIDFARSSRAQHSKAIRSIARLSTVDRRVALSGTPVHNSIMDLWPQLDTIEPEAWGRYRNEFGIRYGSGVLGEYGYVFGEPSHVQELQARLSQVYVYKARRDVLAELPPITRQRLNAELEFDIRKEYRAAEANIRSYLKKVGRGLAPGTQEQLVRITTALKLLSRAKVKTTAQAAIDVLESGEKVVVFTWFKESARQIAKLIGDRAMKVITGETDVDERLSAASKFAESTAERAFVATIAAAGVSLNGLQAASVVLISDLWWAPAKILQAEGRVWRFGQKKGAIAQYVCARGTIDELLLDVLLTKANDAEIAVKTADARGLVEDISGEKGDEMAEFIDRLSQRLAEFES